MLCIMDSEQKERGKRYVTKAWMKITDREESV